MTRPPSHLRPRQPSAPGRTRLRGRRHREWFPDWPGSANGAAWRADHRAVYRPPQLRLRLRHGQYHWHEPQRRRHRNLGGDRRGSVSAHVRAAPGHGEPRHCELVRPRASASTSTWTGSRSIRRIGPICRSPTAALPSELLQMAITWLGISMARGMRKPTAFLIPRLTPARLARNETIERRSSRMGALHGG